MNPLQSSLGVEVGGWVAAACGALWLGVRVMELINGYRKLATSHKEEGQQLVTRAEFNALDGSVRALERQVLQQPIAVRQMIDSALEPMQRKMDSLMMSQAAVCAKLDIKLPGA